MLAQESLAASSISILRINYMNALSKSSASEGSVAPKSLPSPESYPSLGQSDSFAIEMSDIMHPASALESELFGIPPKLSAAVVSATTTSSEDSSDSLPPISVITTSRSSKQRKSSSVDQGHAIPAFGEAVTQPVPEFLCHLFAMLRDPSYADLISWQVPSADEPDHMGGGIAGIGKIVVHQPEALQDLVLGKYYRHSKYASFQRQLNYFGFKKRLHGGKKGKLSPCSYIHGSLTDDVGSLYSLRRRPPTKKRASECTEIDSAESFTSHAESSSVSVKTSSSSKKRRFSSEKKSKKSKKEEKEKKRQHQKVAFSSMPIQVKAEEYASPTLQSSAAIGCNRFQPQRTITMPQPEPQVSSSPVASNHTVRAQQQSSISTSADAQPSLMELLSTSLPPPDVLFNDEVYSVNDDGIPAWVADDGQYHCHNVDSSLVDLAMLY